MTEIPEEARKKIVAKLVEAGCSPDKQFTLSALPKPTYNKLMYASKKYGFGKKASLLVEELGFVTTTPSLNKLLEDMKDEWRTKFYTKDAIKLHLEKGTPLPEITYVRNQSEYLERYWGRDEKKPTTVQVLDSLYSEYPDLSRLVIGTKAISQKTPMDEKTARMLLRQWLFMGDSIYAGSLEYSKDLMKRTVVHFARAEAEKAKKAGRKEGITLTAQLAKLSDAGKGNLFQRDKARTMGHIGEDFARLILCYAQSLDSNGTQLTDGFRKAFPFPIEHVYPDDNNPEVKGVKLEYKYQRKGDRSTHADLIVVSPKDVCMVEVKNIQTKLVDVIRKLHEKILGKRKLVWKEGDKEITKKSLVIHCSDRTYGQFDSALRLANNEVPVVSPQEFRKNLEIVLRILEENNCLRSNVYSSAEILKLYDLYTNSMHHLTRWTRDSEVTFIRDTLNDIINTIQGGEPHQDLRNPNLFSKEGKTFKNQHGEMQLFELSLDDIPYEETAKHIRKKIHGLPLDYAIVDLEQRGGPIGPLIAASIAYNHSGELRIKQALAKNPLQEAPALEYLANELQGKTVISLSDSSFNPDSVQKRLIAYLMNVQLPQNHLILGDVITRKGSMEVKRMLTNDGALENNFNIDEAYTAWEKTGDPDAIDPNTHRPAGINAIMKQSADNVLNALVQYTTPEYHKKK